jgi:hypothetical protein
MAKRSVIAFISFWLIVAVGGCASVEKKGGEVKSPAVPPAMAAKAIPVITQSYASPQIAPGKNWKVYLKASDADGDMEDIAGTVSQPGMGTYPVSLTRIGEKYRKELSGYVYLVIPSLSGLDNVGIDVTLQIRDRAGLFSQPVKLPLSIGMLAKEEPPPPGVFQENDLGPIMVELRTVGGRGNGEPFRLRR